MMPKKKGALAILAFGPSSKGASSSEAEEDEAGDTEEMMMPKSGHEAAFQSFANALSIPPEKRAKASAALKSFVQSCMREYGPEEE